MTQARFRDPPAAVRSAASRAAADHVRAEAPGRRQRVWEFVKAHGPVTREQIAAGVELPLQSVLPLVWQLVGSGNIRVVDSAGVTITGSHAERLMVTGREYSEAPKPTETQLSLPLSAVSKPAACAPAEHVTAKPVAPPIGASSTSSNIEDANAAERERVASDQAKVVSERELFLRLDAEHGVVLDSLTAEQRAELTQRLPYLQQKAAAAMPHSKTIRLELLKLLAAGSPNQEPHE